MNIREFFVRTVMLLRPLTVGMIVAIVATVVAFALLYWQCCKAQITEKRHRFVGIFFGLKGIGTLQLACSWLKLIFTVVALLTFSNLAPVQYLAIILPGVIYIVFGRGVFKRLVDLVWLALQTITVFGTNVVWSYYHNIVSSASMLIMFIALALFALLFALYQFWTEIAEISLRRDVQPDKVWAVDEENEPQQ